MIYFFLKSAGEALGYLCRKKVLEFTREQIRENHSPLVFRRLKPTLKELGDRQGFLFWILCQINHIVGFFNLKSEIQSRKILRAMSIVYIFLTKSVVKGKDEILYKKQKL